MSLATVDRPLPEVWCHRDAEPAVQGHSGVPYYDADTQTGRCLSCGGAPFHEYIATCAKHDPRPRLVPDAITDPWLRAQYAQATGAIDPLKQKGGQL